MGLGRAHWYIYNLGLEAMNINAVFNVAINAEHGLSD